MKDLLERFGGRRQQEAAAPDEDDPMRRRVAALFGLLGDLYGADRLILKAGKVEALQLMSSEHLEEQVLALQRIIGDDPTLDTPPLPAELPELLNQIEGELADALARRTVEERLEKRIAEKMQERHEEYVKEIKAQLVKEEGGPENAQTLKRLAQLEKLGHTRLSRSAFEVLRPQGLQQVVGQGAAIRALLAKVASPYPQHILLYGPPGVGKTTAARLVLEQAKQLPHTPFGKEAPFIEVDGTTLRWDPREVTNPLLGSVHDPIYQGARRELADGGVPEPKPGLVTDAHGGILFIDEIGELDPMLQNKLLKVLEDKRVSFDSAYYDPADPQVPQYVKKLFEEGAPADFLLIGATTRDPSEINPALRSRCAEVYFEPLAPTDIEEIATQAAERLGVTLAAGVAELIADYTTEGRKAVGLLADAYGLALYAAPEAAPVISQELIYEVIQTSRLAPNVPKKASAKPEVGRIWGLGVSGYLGSIIEIEAVAFKAREAGKGTLRFNETAGSMAKDSLFNAAAVIRQVTGQDLANYDLHVNVVGGGRIDGPSAGLAIVLALISAIEGRPLRQDVALTGEVSIRGTVKAIGGVHEKIYGAKQAGMVKVLLPAENKQEIPSETPGIAVATVATVEEAMAEVFAPEG